MSTPKGFLSAPQVWQRLGISSITLHRWSTNGLPNFPKPVRLHPGGKRWWSEAEITAFLEKVHVGMAEAMADGTAEPTKSNGAVRP
jgi:predicted DNA-binding transcriptional regulator AlpA